MRLTKFEKIYFLLMVISILQTDTPNLFILLYMHRCIDVGMSRSLTTYIVIFACDIVIFVFRQITGSFDVISLLTNREKVKFTQFVELIYFNVYGYSLMELIQMLRHLIRELNVRNETDCSESCFLLNFSLLRYGLSFNFHFNT